MTTLLIFRLTNVIIGIGSAVRIVCTQPRRVAAVSVADRVAAERGDVTGGGDVGYQIKMDSKLPRKQVMYIYYLFMKKASLKCIYLILLMVISNLIENLIVFESKYIEIFTRR